MVAGHGGSHTRVNADKQDAQIRLDSVFESQRRPFRRCDFVFQYQALEAKSQCKLHDARCIDCIGNHSERTGVGDI